VIFPGLQRNTHVAGRHRLPAAERVGLATIVIMATRSLHGSQAAVFTTGLHPAFYESVGFMVVAAILSALRGWGKSSAARSG